MGVRYNTEVLSDRTYHGKKIRDKIDAIRAASEAAGIPQYVNSATEHIKVDADKCNGCAKCYRICPTGSYEMVDGKADWSIFGMSYCGECGACRYVCPVDAIEWKYPEGGTGMIHKWS